MLVMMQAGFGGDPIRIFLAAHTVTSETVGVNSVATLRLLNTGQLETETTDGGSAGDADEWMQPFLSAQAGNFEALATVTAGALSTGTAGSWLNLGTSREWTRAQGVVGSSSVTFTLDIRPVGGSILATASMTLTAIQN